MDEDRSEKKFRGANQGALVIAFRIDLFTDPARFKEEMDVYVQKVRALQPLDGFEKAYLPGGIEAERERQYRKDGIPFGDRHRGRLEKLATELGIDVPWDGAQRG